MAQKTQMSRAKFLTALHHAARQYGGGWPTEESEERPKANMTHEEHVTAAMEAGGLKTSDKKAKEAIEAVLQKYGTGYGMPVDPDPFNALVFAENAFEAWQCSKMKRKRQKRA